MSVSAVQPAINHSEAWEIDRCLHRERLGMKVSFREERDRVGSGLPRWGMCVSHVCVCENQV